MPVIPPSSVKAVRPALFTQLQTTITGTDLLVSLGKPGTYNPSDIVWVGNAHRTTKPSHMVGSGGAGWLDESYQIQVTVEVFRGGDEELVVWNRTCDLVDAVEAAVRTDPSIGGLVLWSYPQQASYDSDWEPEGKGRLAVAELLIHFEAIQ
ncbi:hypothetical protein [Kutzneria buriramensis]|uniref:DUF3168 domain-containing protein n=1 Tax=Kutzneria buriramensis TaxID=1045776 RepID=A0A3E0HEQ1_9PSEU|nr:hypothetical protein [Kutzneria buriramensis]REH43643.1 hypothetical protein BCF44_109186 [Kutzneria buriramensis]